MVISTEIVEELMKKKLEVEAVDIVYTFGLEDRFNPQKVLISFLRESKETWKRLKKGSQGSAAAVVSDGWGFSFINNLQTVWFIH